jgi:hypothetical protein
VVSDVGAAVDDGSAPRNVAFHHLAQKWLVRPASGKAEIVTGIEMQNSAFDRDHPRVCCRHEPVGEAPNRAADERPPVWPDCAYDRDPAPEQAPVRRLPPGHRHDGSLDEPTEP